MILISILVRPTSFDPKRDPPYDKYDDSKSKNHIHAEQKLWPSMKAVLKEHESYTENDIPQKGGFAIKF